MDAETSRETLDVFISMVDLSNIPGVMPDSGSAEGKVFGDALVLGLLRRVSSFNMWAPFVIVEEGLM